LAERGLTPAGVGVQVPSEVANPQDIQVPEQAVSQQYPSAQKPLAHSAPQTQAVPLVLFPEPLPLLQVGAGISAAASLGTAASAGGWETDPLHPTKQPPSAAVKTTARTQRAALPYSKAKRYKISTKPYCVGHAKQSLIEHLHCHALC
jgi:hypothetical protein